MPIVFAHTERLHLRTTTFFGVIDDTTLLRAYRDLIESPDYNPDCDDLVDLSGVTSIQVTTDAFAELAQILQPFDSPLNTGRLAIVAPSALTDHIARAYRDLRAADSERVLVCRTFNEAVAWLDVDDIQHAPPDNS